MRELKQSKIEAKNLNYENNQRRKEIIKERKAANAFKFTKMVRKDPYKPLVHVDGFLTPEKSTVEVHGRNLDHRDKQALIFPDKVKDYTQKWAMQTLNPGQFKVEAGREIDQFDIDKQDYFKH